jgi:hypothetical protein
VLGFAKVIIICFPVAFSGDILRSGRFLGKIAPKKKPCRKRRQGERTGIKRLKSGMLKTFLLIFCRKMREMCNFTRLIRRLRH